MHIQKMTGLRILVVSLAVFTVSSFIKGSNGANANVQLENNNNVNKSSWFYSRQHGRNARSIDLSQNCNTWSKWIDDNHPTVANKSELETITTRMREDYCPSYGNSDKVQCKDNKGEPFQGDRNSTTTDIRCQRDQVSCTVKNINFKSCPDLAISFYCSCTGTRPPATETSTLKTTIVNMSTQQQTSSPPTTVGANISTKQSTQRHQKSPYLSTKHSTLKTNIMTMPTKANPSSPATTVVGDIVTKQSTHHQQGSSYLYVSGKSYSKSTVDLEPVTQSNTGHEVVDSNGQDTSSNLNIAGQQVPWWIVILIASFIMFMLNLIITLCIYKKMRHRLQNTRNNKDKRIHPLGDI